ncbi:MAG: LysM peptidoglycan-binding domain-containing M23 family metallopeptidase [Trueperaceae bacterium]|nr:LysM peptidoglycan-binding domain-containing M23 family metallopeptidase [Trueperaceae bacterium]
MLRRIVLAGSLAGCLIVSVAAAQGEHVVRPGDTLYDLAVRYDTDVATLRELNDLSGDLLRVGSVLRLPGPDGWRQARAPGDATWATMADATGRAEQVLRAANPERDDPAGRTVRIPPADGAVTWVRDGEDLVLVAGRTGVSPGTLAERNGLEPPYRLKVGQPLVVPLGAAGVAPANGMGGAEGEPQDQGDASTAATHAELRQAALAALPEVLGRQQLDPPEEGFAWPLAGSPRITSRFGWRNLSVLGNRYHQGLDLAAAPGTPVLAARAGEVVRAGWAGAYGYAVYVRHTDGFETRYAHLQRLGVRVGQRVARGAELGRVGSTGASTGPHLHFETRLGASAVDPLEVLPPAGR